MKEVLSSNEMMKFIIICFTWIIRFGDIDARTSVEIYKQCSPINEPVCQDISYTQTRIPSHVGKYTQNDARKKIEIFTPLINFKCSPYMKLFLCSVYFPICDAESTPDKPVVSPCRQLCNHVKQNCELEMTKFLDLTWPEALKCENFPEKSKICMNSESFIQEETSSKTKTPKVSISDLYQQLETLMQGNRINQSRIDIFKQAERLMDSKCLPFEINVGQSPNVSCSQICSADVQFNGSDKAFANVWLMGWSTICFFSCLLTIIVFSCNTNRFLYPEKPIIFLSICYFFYASGNLLGAILSRRNVACRSYDENVDFLVGNGKETTWCKINFLMVYFFGSASALWWVVLTITWFLSASRHWGYEAIESVSSMLHLLSWAIPALKSIFILILHKIDIDELTGQCFVGNTNKSALWGFVIIPNILYLSTGIIFLTLGYISLLKVRRSFLQRPNCVDTNNLKRLEKLMAKIGVFSILYIVPVLCTVVSYIIDSYKMTYFDVALKALYQFSPKCVTKNGVTWSISKCIEILQPMLPSVEMRMLRIFMNLVIGITSGIWIWGNSKTMRSCITTFKCWNRDKDNQLSPIQICDSLITPNKFSSSQMKQKEILLPYSDWKFGSPNPINEFALPSISVPSEIISPPNNSSISEISSRH